MGALLCDASRSVLIVVDMQPTFMKAIPMAAAVLDRCKFLVQVARELAVPVIATEQNNERMGGTDPSLLALLEPERWPIHKLCFGCCGSPTFVDALEELGRRQAVLCGIETHICIVQTALQLLQRGYEVVLASDAMNGRVKQAHKSAIARMAQAGAVIAHTESIAYEWTGSAEHPRFKTLLEIVKRSPA